MKRLTYLAVFVNLFASGFLFITNGFLLFFQKSCEFCSVLIPPVLVFSTFFLSAIVFIRLKHPDQLRSAKWLKTINVLGAFAALYYLYESYVQ